jgi:hypothetical protein
MDCLSSFRIRHTCEPDNGQCSNCNASIAHAISVHLRLFPYLQRCARPLRFFFIPTRGVREILGLVPSNPRRNTSETSFEVLRTGNKAATRCCFVAAHFSRFAGSGNRAATCCLLVAASLLLCCRLRQLPKPSRQQSGNRIYLFNILSSLITSLILPTAENIVRDSDGNRAATCCGLVAASPRFPVKFPITRSKIQNVGETL